MISSRCLLTLSFNPNMHLYVSIYRFAIIYNFSWQKARIKVLHLHMRIIWDKINLYHKKIQLVQVSSFCKIQDHPFEKGSHRYAVLGQRINGRFHKKKFPSSWQAMLLVNIFLAFFRIFFWIIYQFMRS
jgi:hypothetical protein